MLNQILKRDNAEPGNSKGGFQLDEWAPLCNLPKRYQTEIINRSKIIDVPADSLVFIYNDKDDQDYYLLSGTVELTSGSGSHIETIKHSGKKSLQIIDQDHPRKYNAKAKEDCKVFVTRRTFHDTLNANGADKQHEIPELEVDEIDFESSGNWMLSMLNAGVFTSLPPDSIQEIFVSMESFSAQQGDVIVHEGDIVDYYYLIQHGDCVIRQCSDNKEIITLSSGDSFAGSLIISNAPSAIEIKMLTEGMLMRMPKNSFESLIKDPLLKDAAVKNFSAVDKNTTQLIDVREVSQYQVSAIKNSTSIPINDLCVALKGLSTEKTYVVCGESETQAMIGAFQFAEKSYKVKYLSISVEEYLSTNSDDSFSMQSIKDESTSKVLEVTVDDPPEDDFEKTNTPSQIQVNHSKLGNAPEKNSVAEINRSLETMSIELEKQIRKELNDLYVEKKKELENEINLRFKKYHLATSMMMKKKMAALEDQYKNKPLDLVED